MFLASTGHDNAADIAEETAHAVGEGATQHAAEHSEKLDAMGHILNSDHWELTHSIKFNVADALHIPPIFGIDFTPSLHVIMLWLAGILLFLILSRAAKQSEGDVPRGRLRNFFEAIIVYLRDEVVYNIMGPKIGRRYLPYLLTIFFFILFVNLLGMVPGMATATGNINVTATLAILTFLTTQIGGIRQNGFFEHWKALVPPGVPFWLIPIMIPIEVMGMFTKPFSLTVRLFANMIAGHIIILSFFGLIFALGLKFIYLAVLPLAGAVGIAAFEIFVSFLQAFIFTFLSTIFIYQAVHPEH